MLSEKRFFILEKIWCLSTKNKNINEIDYMEYGSYTYTKWVLGLLCKKTKLHCTGDWIFGETLKKSV